MDHISELILEKQPIGFAIVGVLDEKNPEKFVLIKYNSLFLIDFNLEQSDFIQVNLDDFFRLAGCEKNDWSVECENINTPGKENNFFEYFSKSKSYINVKIFCAEYNLFYFWTKKQSSIDYKSFASANEDFLKAINQLSIKMMLASSANDIYKLMLNQLLRIDGAIASVITRYDTKEKVLRIVDVATNGNILDKAISIIGAGFFKKSIPISDEVYDQLVNSAIRVTEDFNDISINQSSSAVSSALKKMFGVGYYVGLIFRDDEQLVGTSVVVLKKGFAIPDRSLLHTLANLGSAALQKTHIQATAGSQSEKLVELQRIIDNSPAIAFLWRNETNWPVEYVSGNIKQFGYTPDDFYSGRVKYSEIIHRDDYSNVVREVANYSESNATEFRQIYRIFDMDGKTHWVADHTWVRRNSLGLITHFQGIIVDLTREREASEALRLSEEKYRLLTEKTSDITWTMDLNMNFTYVSPSCIRLTGYTPEEEIGNGPALRMTTESVERMMKVMELEIARENDPNANPDRSVIIELQEYSKDGTLLNTESHVSFLRDETGKPYGLIGVTRDISERKKAEYWLHQYELLATHSRDIIFFIEYPSGKILQANRAAELIYGYTSEEFYVRTVADVCSDKCKMQVPERMEKAFNTEILFETEHQRKDKSVFPVEVSSKGAIINGKSFLISIVRDITDRKKHERELANSEAKLRTFINSSSDMIFLKDEEYKYVIVNHAYCQFFQLEEGEILGKTDFDLMKFNEAQGCRTSDNAALDTGKPVITEEMVADRYFEVMKFSAPLSTDKTGIGGIIREITERKLTQKLLDENSQKIEAQNEEYVRINEELSESLQRIRILNQELILAKNRAEESDKLKSAFLANISHEIRTPLNGILGFSNLLRRPDLDNSKINEFVDIINNSGHQLLKIINDVIDISKIEAGQVSVNVSAVNIDTLIKEMQIFHGASARRKGLEILIDSPFTDKSLVINTDDVRLRQIINNLVHNAIKFTEKGHITIGYKLTRKRVLFFVSDTGIGISEIGKKRIFERFNQENERISVKYGGTGLGLSIARSFSELLGGELTVESEEGKGSTFYLDLPLNEPEGAGKSDTEDLVPEIELKQGLVVLVVEDEESNFLYLNEILMSLKFTVVHAENGRQAVDLCLKREDIQLVLMDIKMPVMNGYEALAEIKKHRPDIPVIAQTAYAMSDDKSKALNAGFDDYIPKPVQKDELYLKLNRFFSIKK